MRSWLVSLMLGALASGCATYNEDGLFGGFSETPLASDTYRISGSGNALTSRKKTNAIAMVRAAELAQQNGYVRFIVLDFNEWAKTSYYTSPGSAETRTSFSGSAYNYGYGAYISGSARSTTTYDPGQTYEFEHPRTDIVVRFVPNDSRDAGGALHVVDVLARYGKIAGYRPEELPSVESYSEADRDDAEPTPNPAAAVEPVRYDGPPPSAEETKSELTLDQVYRMLSESEKARVNSLPPSQRAGFLEQIRASRF